MCGYVRLRRLSVRLLQVCVSLIATFAFPAFGQDHGYRLPDVDLHKPIIWGATCEGPDGIGLKFGGEDQTSDDGCGHTQILKDGKWVDIYKQLQSRNALKPEHDRCLAFARQQKDLVAESRRWLLEDDSLRSAKPVLEKQKDLGQKILDMCNDLVPERENIGPAERDRAAHARSAVSRGIRAYALGAASPPGSGLTRTRIEGMAALQASLDQAAAILDCELARARLVPSSTSQNPSASCCSVATIVIT
jgi:hypothetical protein